MVSCVEQIVMFAGNPDASFDAEQEKLYRCLLTGWIGSTDST